MIGLRDGTRLRITAGDPRREEIAAVVAALDEAAAADERARARPMTPAWTRAARREAVGCAPVASAADLRVTSDVSWP